MRFGLIAAACLAALIACSPKSDETDANSNTQTQDAAMTRTVRRLHAMELRP